MKNLAKKLSCFVLIAAIAVVSLHVTPADASNAQVSPSVTASSVPGATSSLKAQNLAAGVKLTWKKVSGATGYYVYQNGDNIKKITKGSTITYTDKTATENGKKYVYKVVAFSAEGKSTKSKSAVTYYMKRSGISSLESNAANKMTVKWGKNTKATGYQIRYSTASDFSSGVKTATIKDPATITETIGSLSGGKTYYVQVKSYKKVNDKNYYSAWSAKKSVKIKKASAVPNTVYITKTGTKYHLDWCPSLSSSKIAISRADAIAKGYEPCKVCKPG